MTLPATSVSESQQGTPRANIPPEIWLEIMRSATDVPDSLDEPQLRHISEGTCLSGLAIERYRNSMATKVNLMGVCRQWYALAAPMLYEQIIVTHVGQLESAVEAAGHLPLVRAPDDSRQLGSFVKRLDLLIPDLKWALEPGVHDGQAMLTLAPRLCKLTPNLLILNTKSTRHWDSLPLCDVVPPTLEYVYWINNFRLPISQWVAFMDAHPRLRYMDPPIFESPERSKETREMWQSKSWPSIQELVWHHDEQASTFASQFATGSFPNLRKLVLTYGPTSSHLEEILSVHGINITSIHFQPTARNFDHIVPLVKTIRSHCPQLQELRLSCFGDDSYLEKEVVTPPSSLSIPGITAFGLHYSGQVSTLYKRKHFCDYALAWGKILPDLRTLRVFQERNILGFRNDNIFDTFLKDCAFSRIKVEDNFGRLLN